MSRQRFAWLLQVIALLPTVVSAQITSRLEVVRRSVIYDRTAASQPGVTRTANGDLLVSIWTGNSLYTSRSSDDGATWNKPELIVSGAFSEIGITTLRDGTILLPFTQELVKSPCCQSRRYTTFVYRSNDAGRTWEGDEPIRTDMREPIPYGKIVELKNGRLLMPVWGAYRAGERWQVGVFESSDRGKTWPRYSRVAYDSKAGCRPDNGFNETSLGQLPNGTVLAVLRQQRVDAPGGPCDVYTEPAEPFYRSVSVDGRTWTHPERLPLVGTSPALHLLPDGTLLLAYRNNPQKPADAGPYGMAVRVSADEGKTWTNEVALQDPKGMAYSAKRQPGYPDFVTLRNGEVLVVFHSVEEKNGRSSYFLAGNVLRLMK
jgi:Neuraminidase (sialidase)